ncbi:PSD1 and planctomycete cytochrome C domain-containing protein [Pirellulales bacterium]|nr:PSD1 and planctomycete cytochrome C domain-containing protein [Pirellulales bacterium]
MFHSFVSTTLGVAITMLPAMVAAADSAPQPARTTREAKVDFVREVQPILAKNCFACHGPDEAESGLSFASEEAAYVEADSGMHAIVPGDLQASQLISRIIAEDESERMPPEGDPLSPQQIETLRRWIAQGAAWSKHWSFEPVQRVDPPQVADRLWNEQPIDALLFRSLAAANLSPNPPADRATLIRRAYYDLIGLPPTAAEVQEFIHDPDPNAFDRVVDKLLQSPHYGERWARYWLDLVRYAETNSYERDGPKPNAWKYRDYVIRSLNDDKPYDQFVREQLAGDELDDVTTETLTATGYYRLGIWDDEPADPLQARYDGLDDIIMTTSQVFLGLTINCARCHDHKIDPIPQTDYYGMLSFFEDVTPYGVRSNQQGYNQVDVSDDEVKKRYAETDAAIHRLQTEIRKIEQIGIAKMSAPDQRATEGPQKKRATVLKEKLKDQLSAAEWKTYQEIVKQHSETAKAAKKLPKRTSVMGLASYRKIDKPTFVLFRGNPHSPSDEVSPRFPAIFGAPLPEVPEPRDSPSAAGRRRILADWITSVDNHLTARVIANRIWQFHFGRGIVRSSNNFGLLGTPPTHPELLDWLAYRLIDGGWKLKSMHRLIMSSRAYQMSSASRPEGVAADPDNDWFWRFDPRRLSAEELRDSILAINGSLNRQVYGPSIYPKLSQEVLQGQSRPGHGWETSTPEQQNRRSVYIHVKRSLLEPMLSAFDFPDPDSTCEARFMTLQPGQALALLNSDLIHEQAQRLVESIGGADLPNEAIVQKTVSAVLSRAATVEEVAEGDELIQALETADGLNRLRAVQLYCLSVMNWNEFLFVD